MDSPIGLKATSKIFDQILSAMDTIDINSYTCILYTCVPTTLFFLSLATLLGFLVTAVYLSHYSSADRSYDPNHEAKNILENSENGKQKASEPIQEGLLPRLDILVVESAEGSGAIKEDLLRGRYDDETLEIF